MNIEADIFKNGSLDKKMFVRDYLSFFVIARNIFYKTIKLIISVFEIIKLYVYFCLIKKKRGIFRLLLTFWGKRFEIHIFLLIFVIYYVFIFKTVPLFNELLFLNIIIKVFYVSHFVDFSIILFTFKLFQK